MGKRLFNIAKSCLYWRTQGSCFDKIRKNYDYVIAYAQGIPTFYVADKAPEGSRKLAWINVTYEPAEEYKAFISEKYSKIDVVNAVSETIKDIEGKCFPCIKSKLTVFRDPINPDVIHNLSQERIGIHKRTDQLTLVTLGRLTAQKGYDIAIDAAKILNHDGIDYIWYILGIGPLESELKAAITNVNLSNKVVFLGVKENPYPYLKLADIYVQTSRHEGFGIAIAEARLLNIPVVATRFNTVFMQMVDRKNGLVADMNGKAVAEAIEELYYNKDLYNSIKRYLVDEPKGNLEIIPQFYEILDYNASKAYD